MAYTKEKRRKILLESQKNLFIENQEIVERLGTPLDKGVTITEDWLNKNYDNLCKEFQFFSVYPDCFLDMITPTDSGFSLFFFQRIALRGLMRYKDVYITAPRAFSKTFLTILALFLQCIFIPGHKCFICSPNKNQAAKVGREKFTEIMTTWPLLRREVVGWQMREIPGNYGKDYIEIRFTNGSQFDVVGALDSTRGGRRHSGLIDEVRDHNEDEINEIVLPLVNGSRRLPDGTVNPKECNQAIYWMTSAGSKMSFSYDKCIDIFEESIVNPESAFSFGCDYRVPALHGLIDPNYINKLKMSPSYKPESFAKEYMGFWTAANDESWFSFDRMLKYGKLKNPEFKCKDVLPNGCFYLLAVDVGRISDQTVVTVLKSWPNNQGMYHVNVVNVVVLGRTKETKPFAIQARDLKLMIQAYKPREVVIDTNGLGVGLGDEMIKTQYDQFGNVLPAYGFINDENYLAVQPKDCQKILYGIKANGPLNSKIHANCYSFIMSGRVTFLISDKEAKTRLLSTKVGQKMKIEQRVRRLMPHEMTSSLFEEMSNLRLRRSGTSTDIVLEKINTRFPKDKYSSFSYGLWRIKEIEEAYQKKRSRRSGGKRQLVFYTGASL